MSDLPKYVAVAVLFAYFTWADLRLSSRFGARAVWVVTLVDTVLFLPVLLHLAVSIFFPYLLDGEGWLSSLTAGLLHAAALFPLSFLVWKLWLYYALVRWDPVRGLFLLPPWPRSTFARGPGRRRPRQFREPMPWDRGPCSY